ncbi:MAG: hypothetical protein DLM73_08970 [Chthoniobacterales bacterium]|nr:MAG: hypothetical protein DLM73_08970 [Chthoniobacterales bacterium]
MRAFHDKAEGEIGAARMHPWGGSLHDPNAKFVDFLKRPDLVRSSLEDFIPYAAVPAIDRFFSLIEWMNGADTVWETTESYLWPPAAPQSNRSFAQYRIVCSARLVFFHRDHLWQLRHGDWAFTSLLRRLERREPVVPNACVGVFIAPTLFVSLSEDGGRTAPEAKVLGVRCYGFGNSEKEAFEGVGFGVDAVRSLTADMAEFMRVM